MPAPRLVHLKVNEVIPFIAGSGGGIFREKKQLFGLCVLQRLLQIARMIVGQRRPLRPSVSTGLNPLGDVL